MARKAQTARTREGTGDGNSPPPTSLPLDASLGRVPRLPQCLSQFVAFRAFNRCYHGTAPRRTQSRDAAERGGGGGGAGGGTCRACRCRRPGPRCRAAGACAAHRRRRTCARARGGRSYAPRMRFRRLVAFARAQQRWNLVPHVVLLGCC